MEPIKNRRKEIIKTIAIIFLIVMLVLTFFSNTIMNLSLPEVSAQYASSGTITTKVRASGSVTANANYSVKITESRKISSVLVKTGDTVAKGDVLFELADSESDELKTALKELEALQNAYEDEALKVNPSYSTIFLNMAETKKKIADTQALLSKAGSKTSDIDAMNKKIDALTDSIDTLTEKITSLTNKQDSTAVDKEITDAPLSERIDAAYRTYEEAKALVESITAQLSQLKQELSANADNVDYLTVLKADAEEALANYKDKNPTTGGTSTSELDTYIRAIQDLERDLAAAQSDYNNYAPTAQGNIKILQNIKETEYVNLDNILKELINGDYSTNPSGAYADPKYTKQKAKYDAAESAYLDAIKALSDKQKAIDDKTIALNRKKEDYQIFLAQNASNSVTDAELDRLNQAVKAATSSLNDATRLSAKIEGDITEKKTALEEAKTAQSTAETKYNTLKSINTNSSLQDQIDSLNADKKEQTRTLDKYKTQLEELKANNKTASELEESLSTLKKSLITDQQSLFSSNTTLERKQKEIDAKEADIEKLRSNAVGASITADVGGTISSVSVVAGEKAESGATLAEIFMSDKGYTVSLTVTKEQAARVKTGDTAAAQYFWNGECNATVAQIKNDPANPASSRIIVLNVTGDVTVGQNITFSLGERGANYDVIVPNSAVREDSNGKFILVVESKSTPLGNRYYASRVDVQVLASDDTQSALSSSLYGNEFIITASTKPISAGDQVRLVESN
ncbi:MAG: biotin/lipoyl-binding protein [Eubacteriales bacterium]